jgi:hypothetical protein
MPVPAPSKRVLDAQCVPRPLTEDESAQIAARRITNLVDKFGKKHEPREKRQKKTQSAGLPEVVPGTVNWKKQDSIPLNQVAGGGRKKKPSGKK